MQLNQSFVAVARALFCGGAVVIRLFLERKIYLNAFFVGVGSEVMTSFYVTIEISSILAVIR